jgi:starch synthase (maltosyl-transferring)
MPFLARLNAIRRSHRSMWRMGSLRFHDVDQDGILVYSHRTVASDGAPGDPTTGDDTVVCVVNVDGLAVREATIHLDLGALGLDEHAPYDVVDELTGEVFTWRGSANYVRLDPAERVGHVLQVVTG